MLVICGRILTVCENGSKSGAVGSSTGEVRIASRLFGPCRAGDRRRHGIVRATAVGYARRGVYVISAGRKVGALATAARQTPARKPCQATTCIQFEFTKNSNNFLLWILELVTHSRLGS